MDQLWSSFLQLLAQFVTPDWGALIGLLPFGLIAFVLLYLGWLVRQLSGLGPTRRGKGRITPRPPEGVHMPGGSFAPIFAAVGSALLLFGLVAKGPTIIMGLIALVLTLLYWGREAMLDYDRATHATSMLPAVIHPGPPAGVHMPGPSFRPILASIAMAVLLYGLVFRGWLLAIGLLMLVVSLVGWLRDARVEYGYVVRADATGHLENPPAPRIPTGTFALFGALFVLGLVLNSGLFPPKSASAAGAGSSAPASAAGASGAPAASAPAADVTIAAKQIQYTTTTASAPAGKAFSLAFTNEDAGVPHNVAIHRDSPTGAEVFKGQIFNGVATKVYQVPALNAGTYAFVCSVHPNMIGTLTVK